MAPDAVSAKGQHYAQSLDLARRLSLQSAQHPTLHSGNVNYAAVGTTGATSGTHGGHSTSGIASAVPASGAGTSSSTAPPRDSRLQDWNELLRKFTKHNATRTLTAQAARTEHLIALHLSKARRITPSPPDALTLERAAAFAFPHSASDDVASLPFPPLPTRILPTDLPEAKTALEALQAALDSPGNAASSEINAARIVLAKGWLAVGDDDVARRVLQECQLEVDSADEGREEGYAVVLRVVGCVVDACAAWSSLSPAELLPLFERATHAYSRAVELLSRSGSGFAQPDKGYGEAELHRWGGEAAFRLCLLGRMLSPPDDALSHHTLYTRLASTASASPRTASLSHPPASHVLILRSARSLSLSLGQHADLPALDRVQEKLVRRFTSVPRAGETNEIYLRFMDEVVQGWRGEGVPKRRAGELAEVLYSALTHTIQSQLLLRHLIHVLAASPSSSRLGEACKALRLYRAYGDKTRETDAKAVGREMRRLRDKAKSGELGGEDKEEKGEKGEKDGEDEKSEKEKMANEEKEQHQRDEAAADAREMASGQAEFEDDLDSDAHFVRTLLFGARLLLSQHPSSSGTGLRALEAAREAQGMAERAREVLSETKDAGLRGNKEVEAEVKRVLGVVEGEKAAREANLSTRTSLHSTSLSHLERAVSLSPTSFLAHFSLSYQLLELRKVGQALDAARKAVELSSPAQDGARRSTENLQAWHLFALCVSAQKDLKGALAVLETALEEEDDLETEQGVAGDSSLASVAPEPTLDPYDHPSAIDQTSRLAALTQLRLTKAAVIEHLEGAPAALQEQQDLLASFSRDVASIADLAAPRGQGEDAGPNLRNGNLAPSVAAQVAIERAGVAGEGKHAKPHRATSLLGRRKSRSSKHASGSSAKEEQPSTADASSPSRSSPSASLAPSASPVPSSAHPSTLAPSSVTATGAAASLPPSLTANPRAQLLLAEVWLACAASFRRAGRMEEAKGAVGEAEGLVEPLAGEESGKEAMANVWSQLALVYLATSDLSRAKEAVTKALSFSPSHLASLILLSRLYLTPPSSPFSSAATAQAAPPPPPSHLTSAVSPPATSPSSSAEAWRSLTLPLAESTLTTLTRHGGWDAPEAWFELSRCFAGAGSNPARRASERECLVRALQLEETRPARNLRASVPRLL
ncbi:hypothetical protein JCM10207_005198 [Rhodosporidiobolus poonsookiae]